MDHHHRSDARPADFGFSDAGDEVLNRFQVRLLTEGSGTQIFSTTFTQWEARATTHYAGSLRAAPTTKIDERTAVWAPRR